MSLRDVTKYKKKQKGVVLIFSLSTKIKSPGLKMRKNGKVGSGLAKSA